AQPCCRRGDVHLLKVKKNQYVPILGREREDRLPHGIIPLRLIEPAAHGAWIGWLFHLIERYRARRSAPQLRAIQVGRQRKEPGRKGGVFAPSFEPAVSAQKGVLCHLLRPAS